MSRALLIVALAALGIAWTQNTASEWFKGIIYAGSGKVQLTTAAGQLATQGSIAASGNMTVGGTLGVTGAATLNSTLLVVGAEYVGGALAVTGALSTASTLAVTGAATLSSTADVTGAASFASPTVKLTSIADTVTASTWSAQGLVAASGLISTLATEVTTAASAGDSKTLPPAAIGLTAIVANHAAANAIDVFPYASDQINNVAADGAVSLAAGEAMFCIAVTAIRWVCVIGSAT